MTDERFQQIEQLIEDAGRCFDPVTGLFESLGDADDVTADRASDLDLEPTAFLGLLGITKNECAEYVQRKAHDDDQSFRNA